MSQPCTICGDPEPSHVHDWDERIEDYFTVGRGESEFDAARRWKGRAYRAEQALTAQIKAGTFVVDREKGS